MLGTYLVLVDDVNADSNATISVEAILDDEWENTERFVGCDVELVKGIQENLSAGRMFITCIGYPESRKKLTALALERGLAPHPAITHPMSNIGKNVRIGNGSVMLGMTTVSSNVAVGEHSYISHGVLIGHDTIIGNNVSIMPGASISGDVEIGSDVLVGAGAIILEKIVVGDGATIGAGSLVTRDVPSGATVVGIPAKER